MIKINDILNKRYQIIKEIGIGGMAKVYEAQDLFLNKKVALKLINLENNNVLIKKRFLQEIKALLRLKHENIISIHDIFINEEYYCLVLELICGKTLKQYLNINGSLSVNETTEIFKNILQGVEASHQKGIIHRDLKPDNILLANDGSVKILDFGIAIIDNIEIKKNKKQVIGTMKYIAPEVVKLQKTTIQSDIYSLGIILYELLIGKVPFEDENQKILANKHIKENIPFIKEINPEISQSLENIIIKATNKNLAKRYKNVNEFKNDLLSSLNEDIKIPLKREKINIFQKKYFTISLIFLVTILVITIVILMIMKL